MNVTLMTDASWCHETQAAGYGYWAVSDRGSEGGGGSMKVRVQSSHLAEMMAVVNALHCALKACVIRNGDCVLVQTDCVGAIADFDRFYHVSTTHKGEVREVVFALRKLALSYELKIRFRHVKGHTGNKDPRSLANKMCDKRAKIGMRAARKLFKLENSDGCDRTEMAG